MTSIRDRNHSRCLSALKSTMCGKLAGVNGQEENLRQSVAT